MCRTSAAYESGEKNGVNGCTPAAPLFQKEGQDHDQELGHLPQPHAASVIKMPILSYEDPLWTEPDIVENGNRSGTWRFQPATKATFWYC